MAVKKFRSKISGHFFLFFRVRDGLNPFFRSRGCIWKLSKNKNNVHKFMILQSLSYTRTGEKKVARPKNFCGSSIFWDKNFLTNTKILKKKPRALKISKSRKFVLDRIKICKNTFLYIYMYSCILLIFIIGSENCTHGKIYEIKSMKFEIKI